MLCQLLPESAFFQDYPAVLYTNTIWIESFFCQEPIYVHLYTFMPDYLPPIGSRNSPPIIPSWMNELGTPYFGCSMIYVQYLYQLFHPLCASAFAKVGTTLNAIHIVVYPHCVNMYNIRTVFIQFVRVPSSSNMSSCT